MSNIYDGQTIEHNGYTFRVNIEHDNDMGEPWEDHDGHGIVSEWTTRDKKPSERVLCTDRSSKRYYDIQASIAKAARESWGCPHCKVIEGNFTIGHHKTRHEMTACSVDADYKRMRGWCDNDWHWCGVVVTLLDCEGNDTDDDLSLWGIESDAGDNLREVAIDLADEIVYGMESKLFASIGSL